MQGEEVVTGKRWPWFWLGWGLTGRVVLVLVMSDAQDLVGRRCVQL